MATSKTMINIQQYSYYLKMELKSQLLDYIAKFCEEGKDFSLHIRAFIRAFRFPLRIIYKSFLQ